MRAAVILVLLWGSMWLGGAAGSAIGIHIYDTRYAPEPPYTEAQLRSIARASEQAGQVARHDFKLWQETVNMGRSVARIEGAIAGSMLLLAVWGTLGAVWLWNRHRDRVLDGVDLEVTGA